MIRPEWTAIQEKYLQQLSPEHQQFYKTYVDRDCKSISDSSIVEQGTQEWLDMRKPLLTASNYSSAVGWNPFVSSKSELVKNICYVPFKGNAATKYGNAMESRACKQFEFEHREIVWKAVLEAKKLKKTQIEYGGMMHDIPQWILESKKRVSDRSLLFVRNSGLHIHPVYKQLAYSPDGVIVLFGHEVGLLEIKCPYRNKYPYPLLPQYYYCQLLGGCFVMNLPFQYFYVWSEKKTTCERFDFDEWIWTMEVFPKLMDFYFKHLLPELTIKNNRSSSKQSRT